MRAGKLRHRIEIQEAIETTDEYGQVQQTWQTVATRWGGVEPLSGREAAHSKQVHQDTIHEVTLRYYAGLTAKHRLVYDGRQHEIISVTNKSKINHEHIVLCKEGR